MNADVRDFEFWLRTAQIKTYNDKIESLRISRAPWWKVADVQEQVAAYQRAISVLDGTAHEVRESAWDDLRRRGRG